jgi:hypothetical protein
MADFYYSINLVSQEDKAILNATRTLEEIHADRVSLQKKALAEIPEEQLLGWLLIEQSGILGHELHDVYIAIRLTQLLTPTGKRRRFSRALRMAGVPFVRVKRTPIGYEVAADGYLEVVLIANLKEAWPDIYEELRQRYNAPGGILPGEEEK